MMFPGSGNFTWVVGFGAKVFSPIKVTEALPTFVELAFLRKQTYDVRDAVHRSFDRIDLLSHTSVVLISQGVEKLEHGAMAKMEEFVISNTYSPWGLSDLPKCLTCDTGLFVTAVVEKDHCYLRCSHCKLETKKIRRPTFIQSCGRNHLDPNKFFILPFPLPRSPWLDIQWKKEKKKEKEKDCRLHI
jgi:hypothetical protein